jgi:DNA-binding IclR family transcriptional regulator
MDKLLESSGASESYARRYLNFLANLGYVVKRPTGWAVLDKAIKQAKPVLFHRRKEDAGGRDSV